MTDLKQTLIDIAAAIVDTPEEVTVVSEEDGDTVNLTLSVAPDDTTLTVYIKVHICSCFIVQSLSHV